MILELLIYLGLGVLIGYVLGNPKARAKVLAKANDWTKPKKEESDAKATEVSPATQR